MEAGQGVNWLDIKGEYQISILRRTMQDCSQPTESNPFCHRQPCCVGRDPIIDADTDGDGVGDWGQTPMTMETVLLMAQMLLSV